MSAFSKAAAIFLSLAALNFATAAWAQLSPTDPNFPSLGTLSVSTGTLDINTDTLKVTQNGTAVFTGVALNQNGGPQIGVFDFSSINIGSGVTLTISGSRALALLSRGIETIQPALTFSASAGALGGFQGGNVVSNGSDIESEPGFGPGGG
jgi:hypothetical protein